MTYKILILTFTILFVIGTITINSAFAGVDDPKPTKLEKKCTKEFEKKDPQKYSKECQLFDQVLTLTETGARGPTGPTGITGASGFDSMINITFEPFTADCGDRGANRIDIGKDTNRNEVLDDEEIQFTYYVCDGRDGLDGLDGFDGIDGKDGKNGKDGKTGPQGATGPAGDSGKIVEIEEKVNDHWMRIETLEDLIAPVKVTLADITAIAEAHGLSWKTELVTETPSGRTYEAVFVDGVIIGEREGEEVILYDGPWTSLLLHWFFGNDLTLQELEAADTAFSVQLETIESDVADLMEKIDDHWMRIDTLETDLKEVKSTVLVHDLTIDDHWMRIDTLEIDLANVETAITLVKTDVADLIEKTDDHWMRIEALETEMPSDTLASLGCTSGQVAEFSGENWFCSDALLNQNTIIHELELRVAELELLLGHEGPLG